MAYIGGEWITVGESKGLGAKINVVSKERAVAMVSERGILAIPLEMNWGADESVKIFSTQDWTRDSLYTFGYNTDAPEMKNIKEMYQGGANELMVVRLNAKGEKASNAICSAKWPGTRGNDLEVSVEADPDSGVIENELSKITVKFTASENQVTATYSNVPETYELVGSVVKDGTEIKKIPQTIETNKITFDFPATVDAGNYEIKACVKLKQVVSLISTGSITVEIDPETHRSVALTKGTEKPGTTVETADATFDFEANKITVTFSNVPEGYKPSVRVKGQVGILGFIPGRLEDMELSGGNKHIVTYSPGAPVNGEMTIEACLTKDKIQVLKSCTYTAAVEGEDKEAQAKTKYTAATPESFDPEIPAKYIVKTFLDGAEVDKQKVRNIGVLKDNDFIVWDKTLQLSETAGMPLTGGTNSDVTNADYSEALNKLETQVFHILACPIVNEGIQQMFIEYTKRLRDALGIKFQTVMPKTEEPANYEGIIQVENSVEDNITYPEAGTIYWVAGLQAGCKVQDSCGNLDYTGAYDIDINYTQRQLDTMLDNGYFGFHLCRGKDRKQHIRTYVDINTLTEFDEGQDENWTRNQTIRVIDQCCNDIATLFNNDYASRIPNTDAGRTALRTDIKNYMEELEARGAIDGFDPSTIVIEQYNKRIIKVEVLITPVNAMEQMYMTIFIQ